MNNLVAYDADSDDESPRRRSSDAATLVRKIEEKEEKTVENRRRRQSDEYGDEEDVSTRSDNSSSDSNSNFAEPPPPKRISERDHSASPAAFRTPQVGMPHLQTSSQASLVSYSGDGDDDDEPEKPAIESAPASELHEPAPPIRQSGDAESDEEQELIDLAIQEGHTLNKMKEDLSPADTPGSETTSESPARIVQGELEIVEELRVPPPPDVEVDPEIVARFERAFRQKAGGADLNHQIQGNQQYNNPMSYATFISAFEIDEKGTNFAANIFDPHCFPENCFFDAIAEEQKKLTEPPKKSK